MGSATSNNSPGPVKWKWNGTCVVGVQTSRGDDVDVDLLVDPLDPGEIAAQTDNRGVNDGVDTSGLEFGQLRDCVSDPLLFVPRCRVGRIVLAHLRADHEHVLVHQHLAERASVDGSADSLDI